MGAIARSTLTAPTGKLSPVNDDRRTVGELLGAVAGNVAAVPIVLGFVVLGGVVLAGRAVVDVAGYRVRRAGKSHRRARSTRSKHPHVTR